MEDHPLVPLLSAAIAVAGGSVAGSERNLLVEFAEWLGISKERAAVVLDISD